MAMKLTVYNCPALKFSHEDLKREIANLEPDIVGITSVTVNFPLTAQAARAAKESYPRDYSPFSQGHMSQLWMEQTLSERKEVDCIARSECELDYIGTCGLCVY